MQVTKEDLKDAKAKLTITATVEEMAPYLDRAAASISKGMKVSGFRSGKIPRDIVEKQVGEMAVMQEAATLAMPKLLQKALDEEKISGVGQPEISVDKIAPGNDFTFSATLGVLPELKLPDLSKIKVEEKVEEVTDEDVQKTLEMLRDQRSTFAKVERAAKDGDQALIDFVGRRDGVKVEGAEGEDHPLGIGSGQFIPGFEDNVIGMKKDDVKTFEVTFPKEYQKKELQNAKVEFTVTVKEVSEKTVPELNDDFAKGLGEFKSLDNLREEVKKNMKEEKEADAESKFQQDVVDAIVKKVGKLSLPEVVIENELDRIVRDVKTRVESEGGKFEDYLESVGKTEEAFREEQQDAARQRVAANLVILAVVRQEGIEASDEDVDKEQQEAVTRYQFNEQVMNHVKSKEYRGYLASVIENRMAIEWLVGKVGEKAEVKAKAE